MPGGTADGLSGCVVIREGCRGCAPYGHDGECRLCGILATPVKSSAAAGESVLNAAKVQLTASADSSGRGVNFRSLGFGKAVDPLYFSAGSNTISGELPAGLTLTSNDPFGATGAEAYAAIPQAEFPAPCSLPIPGTGDCALYEISIFAAGVIQSPANLEVSVLVDPVTGLNSSSLTSELKSYFGVGGTNTVILDSNFNIPAFTINFPTSYSMDIDFDAGVTSVPEPSTWVLLMLGFAGVGFVACRRNAFAVAAA